MVNALSQGLFLIVILAMVRVQRNYAKSWRVLYGTRLAKYRLMPLVTLTGYWVVLALLQLVTHRRSLHQFSESGLSFRNFAHLMPAVLSLAGVAIALFVIGPIFVFSNARWSICCVDVGREQIEQAISEAMPGVRPEYPGGNRTEFH